jgi:uncharacterized membrane protein (UPF0182 family)
MDDSVRRNDELDELAELRYLDPPSRAWPRVPRIFVAAGAAVLALVAWVSWADFYTTWLWFADVGYLPVYTVALGTKLLLGGAAALVATLVAWTSFRLAIRFAPRSAGDGRVVFLEGKRIVVPSFARGIAILALPVAIVVGLVVGSAAWQGWQTALAYWYQAPFGDTDPVFGRDVAYYVFTLPALELVSELLFMLVLASLAGSAAIYFARASETTGGWLAALGPHARAHLLALVAALFLVLAWQTSLDVPALLYGGVGAVAGAGYTDLHATMPTLWARVAASVLVAALAVATIFFPGRRLLLVGLGLYAIALVAGIFYPSTVQRFSVAPNELAKEAPYIERGIAATRRAYALDAVEDRELTGDTTLTAEDIAANAATVENIRLWDRQPLLDTFSQIQEIRTYYEFPSVDNDRYVVDGRIRQTMLSARELAAESLPNRNWINEHLTFTHGFGVTAGPVNEVTDEGLPVLFVKDIPPASGVPTLAVTRPEIYFGELSNDRVYVKTKTEEFNYPSGEQNIFESYAGEGGVSIGSTLRQLLFATRFGDLKLLLSDDMTGESRVLFHRNVRERLAIVAPFLSFDADPYLVVSDGRLFWIADAYTTTGRYPYSQHTGAINYIRNSVKAVVDAYDGRVQLYVADAEDPIVRTYARVYPGILRPIDEMPEGLRAHVRYPEDIFKIQAAIYSTYHMSSPQAIYNKEDQWAVASTSNAQEDRESDPMEPYYTIMKLPGERSEEFLLMLPFTPQRKDNLAAWLAARSDGEHYGKLVAYRFPKQKLVYGPRQIVARVNQDPEISRQLTLWNQRGSQAIFGTLVVIPIERSLVYVQPLYLRAENGKIPELRRVIAVAENRIAMEPPLDESLARLFGAPRQGEPPKPEVSDTAPPQPSGDAAAILDEARTHYERALEAQRAGDWARYGEEIRRLGELLERARSAAEAMPEASPQAPPDAAP